MHIRILGRLLLVGASMVPAGLAARAQGAPKGGGEGRALYELSLGYGVMQSSRVGGSTFWTQGGAVEGWRRLWAGLGVAVDVAGLDTPNENLHVHSPDQSAAPVGFDLITATAGPRYLWQPERSRFSLSGQLLAGRAHAMNSVFPAPGGARSSASSLALLSGGAVDLRVSSHLSLHAIEADWLRTAMPNGGAGVENNLRLSTGLVWRLR